MDQLNHIKKILLINPPIQDYYQTEIRQQALGLKYIQAVLKKEGYETYLLDCLASNKKQTIPIPKQFNYLKQYYPTKDLSPFKLFTHYRHFGLRFQELSEQIIKFNPHLIGISINFTPYFDIALQTAKLCKSILPAVPIVAGGHHATAVPESVLKSGPFDFVILGEGEQRIIKLINYLSNNDLENLNDLDGLAYQSQNNVYINPSKTFIEDLDHLPILQLENDIGMLITSRGCPKNCNFCSIANVMGNKVRFRAIDSVLSEMEKGIRNGVRKFDFEDDHLTINRSRTKKLFREILTRFTNYNLKLSAMNGILADTLDEGLIELMKSAGFEWLNIPLVSGSSEIQSEIDRNQSRQQFSKVVSWAQKYGLKTVAYLIIGLPENNLNQMIDDIIFLAGLPVLIGPSIFYPPPGSETFKNCIEKDYITGNDFTIYRSSAVPVETENFSRQDLITLFRLVRVLNFIKHLINQSVLDNQNFMDYLKKNTLQTKNLIFEHKLKRDEIGILLIAQLFRDYKLKGLFLKNQALNKFQYEWLEYKITEELVNRFLKKIKGKVIRGVLNPFQFRVLF